MYKHLYYIKFIKGIKNELWYYNISYKMWIKLELPYDAYCAFMKQHTPRELAWRKELCSDVHGYTLIKALNHLLSIKSIVKGTATITRCSNEYSPKEHLMSLSLM